VLDAGTETVEALARLLRKHRDRLGTRKNTRAPGVFKQGILVLRWFVDGTRLAQLSRENLISVPTAYRCLHEGLAVPSDLALDLSTALERAAARYTHLKPDGTVPAPTASPPPAPMGPTCGGPGNTSTMVERAGHLRPGRLASLGVPCPPRPRTRHHLRPHPRPDHRTEPSRRHPRYPGIPTLTGLGQENAVEAFRHPVKKLQGRELGLDQQAFNKVIRGIRSVAERANAPIWIAVKLPGAYEGHHDLDDDAAIRGGPPWRSTPTNSAGCASPRTQRRYPQDENLEPLG
jgi:hypothetical protein